MRSPHRQSSFRARGEALEPRELMAADLSLYRASALVASSCAQASGSLQSVGTVVAGGDRTTTVASVSTANKSPSAAPLAATDWYTTALHDLALRDLVRVSTLDNALGRQDMLKIFAQTEKDGTVSAGEFADLEQIVAKTSFFAGADDVRVLSIDVVMGNAANAHYQGTTLGNLSAGSSADKLDKLVHKWFLGSDHPTAMAGTTYRQAAGSLFPHAPVYTDVRQGQLGDCYYLSTLAEAAVVKANDISGMFINNGDGTYTVRFYNNGKADYVTVDSMLPVDRWGNCVYASYGQSVANKGTPLWVALAEKAYVQMNENGWMRSTIDGGGKNSYDAISGGYMFEAIAQITGKVSGYNIVDRAPFESAFNAGKLITFGSFDHPADASVVGNHAYAVVSYSKTKQQVTLFNPWGINNGYAPGLVTLSWMQMKRDFFAIEYGAA